jgi:hypothetical protein
MLAGCLCSDPASSQVLDQSLWGTGTVTAIARSGNTLYVAGALGEAGPNTGGGVPLSAVSGSPVVSFPRVTGYVYAAVGDGKGGWFIGGDFTAVGGLPRSSLAHILSDGSVAPWAPSQSDHAIFGLALSSGTLYVAGAFSLMNGQPRQALAAFDVATGTLLPWDPHADGSVSMGPEVWTIVTRGDTVFVGGDFRQVGGQSRICLAAIDARSGLAFPWYPGGANSTVLTMALAGNTLYLGGYFTQFAGIGRNRAAAVDLTTSAVLPWNPNATGPDDPYGYTPRVAAISIRGDIVFIGGLFFGVGGKPRVGLAAVDADTGAALAWNPSPAHPYPYPYPYVRSLAIQGDTIYVGGNFETISGVDRISLAAIDGNTGAALPWNPRPNFDNDVYSLTTSHGVVYVGGTFVSIGPWQARGCFAAFDLTTGALKNWNPNDNGTVARAMVVSGGKVYVAGDFTFIGGQPRVGVAAIDTLTGAATSWNPGVDNWIYTMLMDGSALYVGGAFLAIGGQPRRYAAALDTSTGLATAWNPDPDDYVTALATNGETMYIGGLFQHMGGSPRAYLAAVDAATAALRPWRADCDSWINALAVDDSTVFAGGQFISTVNGQPRSDLVALDAATGAVKVWDAHLWGSVATPSPAINALALLGHTLYVGGDFYSLGGQVRPCLAALDDSIGLATTWAPRSDLTIRSLALSGSTLYAGGIFGSMGLLPCHGLAALSVPIDPAPRLPGFWVAQSFPNPARDVATIRFSLPTSEVTTLSIFDVQGRRVSMPLDRVPLKPGPHDISFAVATLKAGVYLCSIESGPMKATRKLLVVR